MLSPFVGDSGPNLQISSYTILAQLSLPSSALTDPLPNIGPWTTRNIAMLLLTGHKRLEPAALPGSPSPRGPHAHTCGDAPSGMKLGSHRGQRTHIALGRRGSNPHKFRVYEAGGTGIEPATCGFGACCRSFSNVQGSTRTGWKWPILTVQSTWTFTRVHRRWGQHWVKPTRHSYLLWAPSGGLAHFGCCMVGKERCS